MYCQKCGKQITVGDKFCPFCGGKQAVFPAPVTAPVMPSGIAQPVPAAVMPSAPPSPSAPAMEPFAYGVNISVKSVLSVEEILYPIIEAELAKRGVSSQTVELNGALRDCQRRKKERTIGFLIWTAVCLLMLVFGPFGVFIALVGLVINTALYSSRMKDIQVDNLAYIVSVAKTRGTVPIGQIVAEELMRQ